MSALIVKSLIPKNMEGKNELPQANYTPSEQAELEKSRTISDAELLKGGAEYSVNEKGEKMNLLITERQEAGVVYERKRMEGVLDSIKNLNIHPGDSITIDTPEAIFNATYREVDKNSMLLVVSHGNGETYKIPCSSVASINHIEDENIRSIDKALRNSENNWRQKS